MRPATAQTPARTPAVRVAAEAAVEAGRRITIARGQVLQQGRILAFP
jgi:hypothetical protein